MSNIKKVNYFIEESVFLENDFYKFLDEELDKKSVIYVDKNISVNKIMPIYVTISFNLIFPIFAALCFFEIVTHSPFGYYIFWLCRI